MKKQVFISPLEWGTGHATRIIPIIKSLIKSNYDITIGTNKYKNLYSYLFPEIKIINVPSFNIKYSRKTLLSVIFYLPSFFISILKDKIFINKYVETNKPDIIISDNRYGFYHPSTYNIIITHQLNIQMNGIFKLFSFIIRSRIKKYLKKFDECWVPDIENKEINLTGIFSYHKAFKNCNVKYVGLLSQFNDDIIYKSKYDIELLIMLSGPENQRTIFENIIMKELIKYKIKATLVRGVKGNDVPKYVENITIYDFVYADMYKHLIINSKYIICRAGYTSIMDLIVLNKKALLVPTPFHPEQEFLVKRLFKNGYFPYMEQDKFDILKALKILNNFSFKEFNSVFKEKVYEKYIYQLDEKIHNKKNR